MTLYRIIGLVLTLLLAFSVVTNYGSYSQPEDATSIKEGILKELDNTQDNFVADDPTVAVVETYKKDIEESLSIYSFRQLSLYRMVGCLVMLIGVTFLRLRKSVGLHLFFAGGIFTLASGFYAMGMGILGWIFSLWYIFIIATFGFYFFTKRKELT